MQPDKLTRRDSAFPRDRGSFCRLGILLASAVLLSESDAPAAEPTVTRIYPAGAQVGKTTTITVTSTPADKHLQVWCDRDDVIFKPGEKPTQYQVTVKTRATPGLCWLRFYNAEGSTDVRPFLVGEIPEVNEAEPNNRANEATAADSLPMTANGVLEKSADVDCFRFDAVAGQTVVASITAQQRLGSPVDCVLQLVSPDGFVLSQNDDDYGNDPLIAYTVKSTGTYIARVFGFPEKPNSTVNFSGNASYVYRLHLTNKSFLDHTHPLAVYRDKQGELTATGWGLDEALKVTPTLREGRDAAEVALPGGNWRELPIIELPVQLEAAAKSRITIGSAVSGVLSKANERDKYTFAAKKQDNLKFRCQSRSLGQPTDPVVRIVNEEGTTLKEFDDIARYKEDVDATYRIPADGEYTLEVRDRFDDGGWRFAYVLSVEKYEPDFSLSLAASRFVLKPDKPVEIPVTINRQNFAEEITITAQNLPAGVTAEPIVSMPKGDTAKAVKLKPSAPADAKAFNGTITIIGRAANEQRIARAPTTLVDRTIHDVWLTTVVAAESKK